MYFNRLERSNQYMGSNTSHASEESSLNSTKLEKDFANKYDNKSEFSYEDECSHSSSIETDNLPDKIIESIFVVGSYPWNNDRTPSILYRHSIREYEYHKNFIEKSNLFPTGRTDRNEKIISKQGLGPFVYHSPEKCELDFITPIFISNTQATYVFCYGYEVSAFTFPTFAHNLSKKEIFQSYHNAVLVTTKIYICFSTHYAYNDLFEEIAFWLIGCDYVFRSCIFDEVCNFSDNPTNFRFDENNDWPQKQRKKIINCIHQLCNATINQGITIDENPLQPLSRRIPQSVNPTFAYHSMLSVIQTTKAPFLIAVLKTLLLGKSMYIYYDDRSILTNFIFTLYFLTRPLNIFLDVNFIKAKNEIELYNFSQPTPLIVGTIIPIDNPNKNYIYFNLRQGIIKNVDVFGKFKSLDELLDNLDLIWLAGNEKSAFDMIYNALGEFKSNVVPAIITNIMKGHSSFSNDAFLLSFDRKWREYLNLMCNTTWFQLMVKNIIANRLPYN